ncbi:leucine-rich repeat receptor-like serine/threonine-protein kinase RGI4 [Cornus florida]|uniref:leucine-rich repeat receptor-like serine/threonine-protein kinase RGI4 n=1 Tax=Cornus florida TaxID=4283 RepID=UPI00289F2CF9|nr:leucine-rich repeat receptor-like serine/threonine-protein kinase RGI4 [Cornus florida]
MCNNLPKLRELYLPLNQLSGNLPTSLPKCTELQHISLSINEFTGQIPHGIGNLSKLQILYLNDNSLTGELPDTIFNISSLVNLISPTIKSLVVCPRVYVAEIQGLNSLTFLGTDSLAISLLDCLIVSHLKYSIYGTIT